MYGPPATHAELNTDRNDSHTYTRGSLEHARTGHRAAVSAAAAAAEHRPRPDPPPALQQTVQQTGHAAVRECAEVGPRGEYDVEVNLPGVQDQNVEHEVCRRAVNLLLCISTVVEGFRQTYNICSREFSLTARHFQRALS